MSGLDLTDEQINEKLTMLGLEVEEIIPTVPDLTGVVIGKVLHIEKVADSDHLICCQVDLGSEQVQIICGAPNVAAGQKVPVATVGTILPGGFKIGKAKLRGIESKGMICSEKELNISTAADGIMVLPESAETGRPFHDLLNTPDSIFDVFITPNRPDCLGAVGIARELCISENIFFKTPLAEIPAGVQATEMPLAIEIENTKACPRYSGIVIRDVTIGPSPQWLADRLENLGLRSISNIVDITNFVMLESGQPIHAFDYDKITGGKIIVRNARADEKFITLDDQERKLIEDDLLICDAERAVAIAGIMGGLDSEVTRQTKNILLEVAYFNPATIRSTSSRLDLSTDASKRFERGVDPNNTAKVSRRAIELILQLAGGQINSPFIDVYPEPIQAVTIKLRNTQIQRIIGKQIDLQQSQQFLELLECQVSRDGENLIVKPPTFRPDLVREIDLIEEIARLYGYNAIDDKLENTINVLDRRNSYADFIDQIKKILNSLGVSEAITVSMAAPKQCHPFLESASVSAPIINPLSEETAVLRPTIASTLLSSIAYNLNRKNSDVRLFEIGSTFRQSEKYIDEKVCIGGLLTGSVQPKSWLNQSPDPLSIFSIKGLLQQLLGELQISGLKYSADSPAYYAYGVTVKHKKETVGHFGLLASKILQVFDISAEVFAFELDLKYLFSLFNRKKIFTEISKFPAIDRDIALLVDTKVTAGEILTTIKNSAGKLLKNVLLFDVYSGDKIDHNKKSLAYSLIFQSPVRTLEESEVSQAMEKILSILQKRFGAQLRD